MVVTEKEAYLVRLILDANERIEQALKAPGLMMQRVRLEALVTDNKRAIRDLNQPPTVRQNTAESAVQEFSVDWAWYEL